MQLPFPFMVVLLLAGTACERNITPTTVATEGVTLNKEACLANPDYPGCTEYLSDLEGEFAIVSSKPLVAKAGEKVEITGENFSDGLIVSVNGHEIQAEVSGATQASFVMPGGLANGKVDAVAIKLDKQRPFLLYALDNDDYPLITMESANVCLGIKYFNTNGEILEGLKECDESVPECSEDGEKGCVTSDLFVAASTSNLSPGNIASGVVIAGVMGEYPSADYPLAGATSDIDLPNLDASIAAGSYEWFKEDGTRVTGAISDAGTINPGTNDQSFSSSVYRQFTVSGDADLFASNIKDGQTIFGITGSLSGSPSNCSSNGETGCIATPAYQAADLTNLSAGNIKSGVTIAGQAGDYPSATNPLASADGTTDLPAFTSASGGVTYEWFQSDGTRLIGSIEADANVTPSTSIQTLNAGLYRSVTVAGDADLIQTNIKDGTQIFGIDGNVVESPADCSGNAQTGCVTTSTYKSADLTNLLEGNIKNGTTIAGVAGLYPNDTYKLSGDTAAADLNATDFEDQIKSATAFEYFDATGAVHAGAGDADIVASKIKTGVEIFGANGSVDESPADCNANAQTDCVTTSTYKSADLTNLLEGNIKNGITIAGVAGLYPNNTYKLDGQDGTADLDFDTFNAQIKSSTAFEWFDSTGERFTYAGDEHIQAGLILSGVDIFGTTGTFVSGSISASSLTATTGASKIALTWSFTGDGVIIVKREAASITWTPDNGTNYSTGAVDANHEIIYKGALSAFDDTSVVDTTTYYYKAFAYNADNAFSAASNEESEMYVDGEICGGSGDECYDDTAATTAGTATTPLGKSLEYVDNGTGFYVWKEVSGNRILRANGADEWAKNLNADGKGQSGTYFMGYTAIVGRVCPDNVYIDDANKFTTGNCVYYTSESNQTLHADGSDGIDGLTNWNNYNGGSAKWYVGNIQTCSTQGMRLPTIYETATTTTSHSYYPTSDGSPTFAQGNGIPSNGGNTWTASAVTSHTAYYWVWSGTSAGSAAYSGTVGLRCILP